MSHGFGLSVVDKYVTATNVLGVTYDNFGGQGAEGC